MTTRTVYFDRKAGGANCRGRWTTIVKNDERIKVQQHSCEFEGRASIGLTGGSKDPLYQPTEGATGGETVEDSSS